MKSSFHACGQLAQDQNEAVAQARLTLTEALAKAKASRDTYTIRQWDNVAQAARKVLVEWGYFPASVL